MCTMRAMPIHRLPRAVVDTARRPSVSFGRPDSGGSPVTERAPVAVGPGAVVIAAARREAVREDAESSGIQLGKVQAPALRTETLERPRLLDWLRAKIHSRVVLLIADAGYGKTTLLADFSRRTRLRTLWYRLDETDRDWTSFLRHLVAAGREHDPSFAPNTSALLGEIGVGGPTREIVLDTFLRELEAIAREGAIVVFDDFHLVDDAPDARHIARELVARAPERLTFVFASRRQPTFPLSKLRAVGEVAELGTDDLRFDAAETAQLFTETYGRQVEADVLVDLARRTEGWIASLQLVHAALRNRTPTEIRHFVRTFNGADHEMYDYLAEEVVGDLHADLQHFLNTTSILQVVTAELAEVVSEYDRTAVSRLMLDAERLTLLTRMSGGPRTHLRYHPLVREFLEARFALAPGGEQAIREAHRRVAASAPTWALAAHHFRAAGDTDRLIATIHAAIPQIMGAAEYSLAASYLEPGESDNSQVAHLLVKGRMEMQMGNFEESYAASLQVLDSAKLAPVEHDYALLNLVSSYFNSGDGDGARHYAKVLRDTSKDPNLKAIAEVTIAIVETSSESDLAALNQRLLALADRQRERQPHHRAVTLLNLALNSIVQDDLEQALNHTSTALDCFLQTSALVERHAATVAKTVVLLRMGRPDEARRLSSELVPASMQAPELLELADAWAGLGSSEVARPFFDSAMARPARTLSERRLRAVVLARSMIREGDGLGAAAAIAEYPDGASTVVGLEATRLLLVGEAALVSNAPSALDLLEAARTAAATGGYHSVRRTAELLTSVVRGPQELDRAIRTIGRAHPWQLAWISDTLLAHLDNLSSEAQDALEQSALIYSDRFREAARRALDAGRAGFGAARLLERVGQQQDVPRLRRLAKAWRRNRGATNLGRALARRTAERVLVEDQGRVSIKVGAAEVPGSSVRRKVLALLCFLLSRPNASATRDQVLDALWPDLPPEVAVNSLNQTLYFLRRVFEPDYVEDTSPGYVNHDSEVVWLDPELVTSRSIQTWSAMRGLSSPPEPSEVDALVELYRGRFALDFEYEEWAGGYRDTMHAAYLEVVERAVADDLTVGHYDRAIRWAQRALEVDPEADSIEVSLLRLYRNSGAHAAAAEQYEHYSNYVRQELGVEPPALEAL
jgi:DNA-binding SARP family transcriptional activator